MDAIEIYGSREFTGWEVYGVIENGVCVAYIIISEKEFGDKTHHFREIWVTPELRGRGYASILILFLLNKFLPCCVLLESWVKHNIKSYLAIAWCRP